MQATQQLPIKDIHLPDTVSWWPPAPGYWLLLALIVLIIAGVYLIHIIRQRNRVKKSALAELKIIKQHYQQQADDKTLVNALAALLRRAAISSYPRSDCASLTGKAWLSWLDKQLKQTPSFSNGPGYLLLEFNYSNASHANDIQQLLSLTESWIKNLPASKAAGVKD